MELFPYFNQNWKQPKIDNVGTKNKENSAIPMSPNNAP